MIVVVGDPTLRPAEGSAASLADGLAAAIARACVAAGAAVQIAGKIGDDEAGNEILLSLSRDGIGHVALLRDAGLATRIIPARDVADPDLEAPSVDAAWARETDAELAEADAQAAADEGPAEGPSPMPRSGPSPLAPEDLDLALRYLVTFDVLVVAEPVSTATLAVAAEAASFSGAHLVIAARTADVPPLAGDAVTVLEAPPADPDGDFAALVARYAVALDAGQPPAPAFRAALGGSVWESAAT